MRVTAQAVDRAHGSPRLWILWHMGNGLRPVDSGLHEMDDDAFRAVDLRQRVVLGRGALRVGVRHGQLGAWTVKEHGPEGTLLVAQPAGAPDPRDLIAERRRAGRSARAPVGRRGD